MPNIANVAFVRLAEFIFDKAQTIPVITVTNTAKIDPNVITALGSSGYFINSIPPPNNITADIPTNIDIASAVGIALLTPFAFFL